MNASRHMGLRKSASHELQPRNKRLRGETAAINRDIAHNAILAQIRCKGSATSTRHQYSLGRSILHGDPLGLELQVRRTPNFGNTGERIRIMKVTVKDLFGESQRTIEVLADYIKFFEKNWIRRCDARAISW